MRQHQTNEPTIIKGEVGSSDASALSTIYYTINDAICQVQKINPLTFLLEGSSPGASIILLSCSGGIIIAV